MNDLLGPAVNISGIASFGTATSSPTARSLDVYEGVDNISIQHGRHSFKTGSNFLWDRTLISFPGALQGVYTFPSLANFQAGKYVTSQQAFGLPGTGGLFENEGRENMRARQADPGEARQAREKSNQNDETFAHDHARQRAGCADRWPW